MARAASRATTATATPRSSRSRARLKPLGARALWICGQRHALPTTPQGHQQQRSVNVLPKSVKLTCYRQSEKILVEVRKTVADCAIGDRDAGDVAVAAREGAEIVEAAIDVK